LPFYTSWAVQVRIPGRDSVPRVRDGGPYINEVTPGYFATVGTRILRGRGFTDSDQARSPRVTVVNESMARIWWPNEDAIGKCIQIGGDTMPCSEVVGIVENARRQSIIEDTSLQYFIPGTQSVSTNASFVLLVSPQKRSWQLGATMFTALGGLALVLAAVGLYSVLAYDVAQRTREFGVRVAMGARGADVMRLVLARGLRTALVGGMIGVGVAVVAGRWVAPLLFRTSPTDPAVIGVVVIGVVFVALMAALIPAKRALSVDPIEALRAE
jgi:putative ABC transport system permease protein